MVPGDFHGWACKQNPEEDGTESGLPSTEARTEKAISDIGPKFLKELMKLMASDTQTAEMIKGKEEAKTFIENFWKKSSMLKKEPDPFDTSPNVGGLINFGEVLRPNLKLQSLKQKYLTRLGDMIRDQKTEKKIETEIFPDIKRLLIEEIMKSVPDPVAAQKMAEKIEKVRFAGTQCQDNVLASNKDRRAYFVKDDTDPSLLLLWWFFS